MTVYVATWNLNKEKPNYSTARDAFIKNLQRHENIGDPGLESTRFISSSLSADQLAEDLHTKMDGNDKLIVSAMRSDSHQGWLAKNVWDWINARL